MSDTSLVFNLVARDRASGEVSAMGERFNTAAAGIGAGFAAALGASVLSELDIEAAGDKLAGQLGVGPAEAAELAKVSANVYQDAWGDSTTTVNEAIRGVYKNIGDVSEAEGGLEGVTKKALALAQTFDQDLAMTTAAVGQLMRTGLAKSADEAFDIITVGLQGAADKSGDYLETLNEYSTQWRRVGVDGKAATGLLSQALQAGARDADQVADAIGIFGETALKGGTAVDTAYKSIGLSSKTVAKLMREGGTSATQAFQMTMDALRGTEDRTVRLNAAAALFGDPANIMGDALYALDPASAAAAGGMDKASGAADRMTATVGNNATHALEKFKRGAMAELGQIGGAVAQFAMTHQAVVVPLAYTFTGLAVAVLAVKAAMAVYAAGATVVTAAQTLISASCWTVMGNWIRMNAIGLGMYAKIAGAAVVSAATTSAAWLGSALAAMGTWLAAVVRTAVTAVAQFAVMAARAVVWAATMAAQWLIAMGPVGWVIGIIIGLVALVILNWDKIKNFTKKAWDWVWQKIQDAVKKVIAAIEWLGRLPKMVSDFFGKIKEWAIRKMAELIIWLRDLPGKIGNAIGNLKDLLIDKGKDVVRGLLAGVQSMGGWIAGKLIGWAKSVIPGPIAKALGIASPSKVTAKQGEWIARGLVVGMTGGLGQIRSTAKKMADIIIDATSVTLTPKKKRIARKERKEVKGTKSQKKRIREQNKEIDQQNKEIDEQNRKIDQQNKKIDEQNALLLKRSKDTRNKAMGILNRATAQLNVLAKREEQVAAKLKTANAKLADLVKARNALAADVKKGVLDAANITQGSEAGGTTATSIWATLNAQLAKAKRFAEQLAILKKKGVRADLIAQIAQAGVEQGGAAAAALASASSGQIAQINSTQKQLVDAATKAGTVAGDAMYGAGIQAAQGLVHGLEVQQKQIEKQMLKIAMSMQAAIKKALGIRSPSRVMATLGQWIPAGLVRGIEDGRPAVARTMNGLVQAPPSSAGLLTGQRLAPAPLLRQGGGGGAGGVVVVRLETSGADSATRTFLQKIVRVEGRGNVQVAFGQP
ncbi:phage tail tape measure protein [Streptomyces sp. NPDC015130]|uniref:phage tail tape measure protein n=1 Tax=Streptomyces sp. NPDC015130 TaxID=3364940 RepID=UPI0036FEC547